jgi:hypothetical protein
MVLTPKVSALVTEGWIDLQAFTVEEEFSDARVLLPRPNFKLNRTSTSTINLFSSPSYQVEIQDVI